MFSSTGSNHPIIPKQTNLYLTPHYITFHSEDRDETKYLSASQWATRLPQNINNIRSMHLVDCYIPPRHMFVFKNDYQNLAFMVRVKATGADECLIEQSSLYNNCSKQSMCTPRLNLSRPLVPHSNVKFNEDTKNNYVNRDLSDNVINYQIPTSQLQNSFSAPQNCTSHQNNLIGLNNMSYNKCYNEKLCRNEYEKGGEGTCDCVDITPTANYPNENYTIRYTNCCDQLVTIDYNYNNIPDTRTIKCIKTEYHSGFPYWSPGASGYIAKFTVISSGLDEWNYVVNITNCGEDNQVLELNNSRDSSNYPDNPGLTGYAPWPFSGSDSTTYTVTPSETVCCTEEGGSQMANIPCAPRSMCEQETALLRVNGTIPPYIRQMRENEDKVQKGEQPMEFNYDGCNAYCNSYDFQGAGCAYYMIRIKEGLYTGLELAQVLQQELQQTIPPSHNATWKVHFSEVNCRLYFYLENNDDNPNATLPEVEFRFDWKINYQSQNFSNKNQPEVWSNKHWWGLGYYLGFNKQNHSFFNTTYDTINKSEMTLTCNSSLLGNNTTPSYNENYLLKPPNHTNIDISDRFGTTTSVNGLVTCRSVNIEGPSVIYMEVEKYNNCDEITPGPSNTNSTYNNTFTGKLKAVFAKLEVRRTEDSNSALKSLPYTTNMKNFLEERINKLEFKFRFHDGRYVYFGNNKDVNFTIQFNCAEPDTFNKVTFNAVPGWTAGV